MTGGEGAEEGPPLRRHARPSEPAVPWPGGDGAPDGGPGAPPGSYETAPATPPPRREQPARPPRALPPGRHAGQDGSADGPDRSRGSYQGMRRSPDSIDPNDGYPRDGGYPDDGPTPRDGRNRRDRGNPRNVEDPRGAAFPAGRGPARADSYRSDRGPFGDEDPSRDRGYEQGDRPPGGRASGAAERLGLGVSFGPVESGLRRVPR